MNRAAWYLATRDRFLRGSSFFLVSAALALGLSCLVSVSLFSSRILNTVERDAKGFLSSDIRVESWTPLTESTKKIARDLVGPSQVIHQSDVVVTADFDAIGPKNISLRALEGAYPFYGTFETEPLGLSIDSLASGKGLRTLPGALVATDLQHLGVGLGSKLRLGEVVFQVVGFVRLEPQSATSAIASGPRVIIHQNDFQKTGYLGKGSRVFDQLLVKTANAKTFENSFRQREPTPQIRLRTPDRASEQVGEIVGRLRSYLSVVAIMAILLGGVALFFILRAQFEIRFGALQSLRCLGLGSQSLRLSSLLQVVPVWIAGSVGGIGLGFGLEALIAALAHKRFLVDLASPDVWPVLTRAMLISLVVVVAAIFSPLADLLEKNPTDHTQDFKMSRIGIAIAAAAFVVILVTASPSLKVLGLFVATIIVVIVIFSAVFLGSSKGFEILNKAENISGQMPLWLRHGLQSMFRRRISSLVLVIGLGFSVFLVGSVLWISQILKSQANVENRNEVPNFFALALTKSDLVTAREILGSSASFTPVFQARLASVKGAPLIAHDVDSTEQARLESREYVLTRRNVLGVGEALSSGGELFGPKRGDVVRISLEERFAKRIGLAPGDSFQLTVAGINLPAVVTSLRSVNWFNFRPNFFMVASEADVAYVPVTYVGTARIADQDLAGTIQTFSKRLPQSTSLDASAVSKQLLKLLDQVTLAFVSIASLVAATSGLVVIGIVLARRRQKFEELSLWACLGLGGFRLVAMGLSEFVVAGVFSAVTGLGLSALFVSLLSKAVLGIAFSWPPTVFLALSLLGIPLALGLLAAGILSRVRHLSASELLRSAEDEV